jgi:hypothetical protein
MDYQTRHIQKILSPLKVTFIFIDAPYYSLTLPEDHEIK